VLVLVRLPMLVLLLVLVLVLLGLAMLPLNTCGHADAFVGSSPRARNFGLQCVPPHYKEQFTPDFHPYFLLRTKTFRL
jgi:ABC-type cobalt transport system substrate-binding protein